MKLDKDSLVGEEHEADEQELPLGLETKHGTRTCASRRATTYVHHNGDDHELGVELDQGGVFLEAMVLDEALTDGPQEVPVEEGIHNADEDLGDLVPVLVDLDEAGGWLGRRSRRAVWGMEQGGHVLWRGVLEVGGDEDGEDGHVDGGYDGHGAPLFRVKRGQSVPCVGGRGAQGPGARGEARTRIQATVSWLSEMTAIRLMMICISS